jgi:hypothetical protein
MSGFKSFKDSIIHPQKPAAYSLQPVAFHPHIRTSAHPHIRTLFCFFLRKLRSYIIRHLFLAGICFCLLHLF